MANLRFLCRKSTICDKREQAKNRRNQLKTSGEAIFPVEMMCQTGGKYGPRLEPGLPHYPASQSNAHDRRPPATIAGVTRELN